jgi:hypothetical protein
VLRTALQIAAVPASLAATVLFLALPAWSVWQLLALALVAVCVTVLIGRAGAGFLAVALLAFQGTDVYGESGFVRLFLPTVGILCAACVVMCLVLRFPSLGERIEHGPLGPGGI